MNLFKLMGTVSIDTSAANKALDDLLAKVKEIEAALGKYSITVSSGTPSGSSSSSATPTSTTSGNKSTSGNSSNSTVPEDTSLSDEEVSKRSSNDVMWGNLKTQFVNWGVALGKSVLQTGWDYNLNMDSYQSMLQTYLKADEETSGKFLKEIEDFAIRTPLSMSEAFEQSLMLLATGTKKEDLISTLSMLGDIAGGNTERFGAISKAYWQIMSTGKLIAQDANQLTQAGVPIWDMLAEYFNSIGRSQTDRRVLGQKYDWTANDVKTLYLSNAFGMNPYAQASSEEVQKALMASVSEGGRFFNAMANYMESGAGQLEQLKDQKQIADGAAMKPLYDWLTGVDEVTGLSNLQALINMLEQLGNVINWVAEKLGLTAEDLQKKKEVVQQSGLESLSPEVQEAIANGTTDKLTGAAATEFAAYQLATGVVAPLAQIVPEDDYSDPNGPFDNSEYGPVGRTIMNFLGLFDGTSEWISPFPREGSGVDENGLGGGGMRFDEQEEGGGFGKWNTRFGTPSIDWEGLGGNSSTGGSTGIAGAIAAAVQAALAGVAPQLQSAVSAGAAEGVGGITVTGSITTGNVTLDSGAIVGQLAPRLDLRLGKMNGFAGRG